MNRSEGCLQHIADRFQDDIRHHGVTDGVEVLIIGGAGCSVLCGIQKPHMLLDGYFAVGICQLKGGGNRIFVEIRIMVRLPDIGTEMKRRDEQDLVCGNGLQQKIDALGCAIRNLLGGGMEAGFAVVGAQHQEGRVQRLVGSKDLRKGGVSAKTFPKGVFKHGRSAVAAFFQNTDTGILQLFLKQTGPTDVLWKTFLRNGVIPPGVGIAIA